MVSPTSACLFIVLYASASLNRDSCRCRSELRKAASTSYILAGCEGKTPVHEVPAAGNGETGFETGVSDCL